MIRKAAKVPLPTAREVRDVLGQVEIGNYLVTYHDHWGDERFPWRVCGPKNADDFREILDEFASYREAVRFARRERRKAVRRSRPRSPCHRWNRLA